ncbi:hypothetical protein DCCM_3512 [Desulfocucumis palustris]|uniref:Uncharacterized protein n=1 Tax=Desulfocucumis palustris TaxID=1898651 RepID=A0A2L2XDH2_9FIRM|nr:hypothetical protein DCCM_3512 [Desulfocucumis palustris]
MKCRQHRTGYYPSQDYSLSFLFPGEWRLPGLPFNFYQSKQRGNHLKIWLTY